MVLGRGAPPNELSLREPPDHRRPLAVLPSLFSLLASRLSIFSPMLSLTFLGTSAARPTVERNVSSISLVREAETLLFDCGEGTQRQMMRSGVSFAFTDVFFTHFHADHFLGIIGLVRTLGLQGRTDPMHLYGPSGAERVLSKAIELGVEKAPFPIEIHEFKPGHVIKRDGYDLETFPVEHGGGGVGYVLREHRRLGRF